jgi:rRNA-processing protein FCF1
LRLGLADAAIGLAARKHGCTVLTGDLDLYLSLRRDGVEAIDFTHVRAQNWRI